MKFKDLIAMALRNLNARRLRTFLTVLGVVIGATSIIIMLSIGVGFKKINNDFFASLGDLTVLDVRSDMIWSDEMEENARKDNKKLNTQAVNEIKQVPHVSAVMALYSGNAQLKSGRLESYAQVVAIDPSVMDAFGYKVQKGRLLNATDKTGGVVLGSRVENFNNYERRIYDKHVDTMKNVVNMVNLHMDRSNKDGGMYDGGFDTMDGGMNSEPKELSEKLKVVGVLEDTEDWQKSQAMIMSFDYLEKLQKDMEKLNMVKPLNKVKLQYDNIKVKVDDAKNVDAVTAELKDLGYNPTNFYADMLKQSQQQLVIVQAVFGAIGGIAFLVAAIGITNTMIMSIYERTKEIGVMKVIGASIKDIQKLFLVESGFIGFIGGALGIIFSLLLSVLFNTLTRSYFMNEFQGTGATLNPKISVIPPWLIITALVFSSLVGVIAGYIPARRAMKLSALEAIRTE